MIMVLVNHKHGVGRPGPGGRGEATDTLTGPGSPPFSGTASPSPAGALLAQESLTASSGETA